MIVRDGRRLRGYGNDPFLWAPQIPSVSSSSAPPSCNGVLSYQNGQYVCFEPNLLSKVANAPEKAADWWEDKTWMPWQFGAALVAGVGYVGYRLLRKRR